MSRVMQEFLSRDLTSVCCKECGVAALLLTRNHMETHGITKAEYISRHPEHADGRFWGNTSYDSQSWEAHKNLVASLRVEQQSGKRRGDSYGAVGRGV